MSAKTKNKNKHDKWLRSLTTKQLVTAAWPAGANLHYGMDRERLLELVLEAPRRGLLHKRQVEACQLSPYYQSLKEEFTNSAEYRAGMTRSVYFTRNCYMRFRVRS